MRKNFIGRKRMHDFLKVVRDVIVTAIGMVVGLYIFNWLLINL
jgi:hypothetical protein